MHGNGHGPESYPLLTYAWVIGISIWAGIAGYLNKIKSGKYRPSIVGFVGEIFISSLVGIITFFLCESANVPPILTAALIGVTGHMGSRALFLLDNLGENLFKKITKQYDQDD